LSTRAGLWHAVIGVLRRDAVLFWSYRFRVLSQTLTRFMSLALFYYLSRLVTVGGFRSPDVYFGYVAVGIVILTVLTATLTAVPIGVRQELVAGTFERFVVSPTGAVVGVAAMLLFPLMLSVLLGIVQIVLAGLVFGLDVQIPLALLAVPAAVLAAAAFAPLALLVAAAAILAKQAAGSVTIVTTGMALAGGFFFPVTLLPGWIRWVSEVQPFTPALELMRHLVVGAPLLPDSGLTCVSKLGAFTLVLLPVTLWVLDRAVAMGRGHGTLTEY